MTETGGAHVNRQGKLGGQQSMSSTISMVVRFELTT